MSQVRRAVQTVFLTQVIMAALVIAGTWFIWGWTNALAALYGAVCGVIMMVLLGLKISKLDERLEHEHGKNIGFALIAVGFVPRFLLILAAFAIGIGILELPPLPLLLSYAIIHLAYLLSLRPSTTDAD